MVELKAYNLRLKKKENMKDPHLTTKARKTKKGTKTMYAVWGKGSDGTILFKIVSKDDYAKLKKDGISEKQYKK